MRAQSGIFSFPVRRGSTVTAGGLHPAAPREAPAHFLVKASLGNHGAHHRGDHHRIFLEQHVPAQCHLLCPSAPGRRRGGESILPAHAGGAAGTHGTRRTCCPAFPACRLCAATSSPVPQPCPAVQPCCSPVSSLPFKTRGRVRARPVPLSSLFCTEGLLAQAGTCISSASDAVSLPGNVRGSFELISRKAAGFCGRWQQECLSEVTASPGRRGAPWARTRFADGRVKPPVTKAQPNPGRAVQDGCGRRTARCRSLSLPGLGEPLPVSSTEQLPAVGSGRALGDLFKSQGWSNALSHQCCLAHPIRDTVALIKPKQSLN